MAEIAIIGDRDTAIGFKGLGFSAHPTEGVDNLSELLDQVVKSGAKIIFITEQVASKISSQIEELNKLTFPMVVLIPSVEGSLGLGLAKLKSTVEKAVGADVISK